MENVALKKTVSQDQEYHELINEELDSIADFYKVFHKEVESEKSEIDYMLNQMLVHFLISDDSGNMHDKLAHKKLIDCCLVMVHHMDRIMKLQKKHDLYED